MGWDVGGTRRLAVSVATLGAAASAWWLYAGTHPLRVRPCVAEAAVGWRSGSLVRLREKFSCELAVHTLLPYPKGVG